MQNLQDSCLHRLTTAMPSRCYLQRALAGEQRNKKILDEVKKITHNDLCTILKNLDRELVKGAIAGEKFQEYFFANCKCEKLAVCVKELLEA